MNYFLRNVFCNPPPRVCIADWGAGVPCEGGWFLFQSQAQHEGTLRYKAMWPAGGSPRNLMVFLPSTMGETFPEGIAGWLWQLARVKVLSVHMTVQRKKDKYKARPAAILAEFLHVVIAEARQAHSLEPWCNDADLFSLPPWWFQSPLHLRLSRQPGHGSLGTRRAQN